MSFVAPLALTLAVCLTACSTLTEEAKQAAAAQELAKAEALAKADRPDLPEVPPELKACIKQKGKADTASADKIVASEKEGRKIAEACNTKTADAAKK